MNSRLRFAVLCIGLLGSALGAQPNPSADTPSDSAVRHSALTAEMFYQLLLGEMQVHQGSSGAGFSLILDAARKLREPALFERALDIALRARSGEAAMQAAQAWKREIPGSIEANRHILQILLALNRIEEAGQALAVSLDDLPAQERQAAIVSIPRVFARVSDKALAAKVVEKALKRSLEQAPLQASAWTTIGRMYRDAQLTAPAVQAALRGHASDTQALGPLILGLSLLPTHSPEIRLMLERAMQGSVSPELRLSYARGLIALPALQAAMAQLQQLSQSHPDFAPAWLLRGLLHIDLGEPALAQDSLKRHVQLVKDSTDPEQQSGLTEALMALSQLAQQGANLEQAAQWLKQIPASADPVRLAIRRAQVLEQQGLFDEARVVLTQVQAVTPEQAKNKTLALSRWLREHRQAQQAHSTLEPALAQNPDDADLLIELSLVLEKLQHHDEMEAVLRKLMQMRPQDPQAFNALGYSLADRGLRLPEAQALILKAVELAPQDPFIQDSLGWVAFRMGRHEEALRILRTAFQARPDAEIAAHLGEVLWQMNQREEAAKVWREGLLLKADNETLQETLKRLGFAP